MWDQVNLQKFFPDKKDFDYLWNVNYFWNYNITESFIKFYKGKLYENEQLSITFVSSICAETSIPCPVQYATSKTALVKFAKELSVKLAPEIRANIVSLGNIYTKEGVWGKKLEENPNLVESYIKKMYLLGV